MQRDVLSQLRISESQKREEIQGECQKLRKSLEVLEMENCNLNEVVVGIVKENSVMSGF